MSINLKSELSVWFSHFIKYIPGILGCRLRAKLLKFKGLGKDVKIWDNTHIEFSKKLVIGDRVSINRGCNINCAGGLFIGDDVLIGPYVTIYTQNHNYLDRKRKINQQGFYHDKVVIENDVWIAANVTILPGVVLSEGCVIGAGSIVTSSTEPYCLYVGSPARKIKGRY